MAPSAAMRVRVFESAAHLATAVADAVERAVSAQPDAVLALATGRTPLAAYAELARRHAAGGVDVSRATLFGIDEFAGVLATHPGSFAAYLAAHLVQPLEFDVARVELLDGAARDRTAECARYERAIGAHGGLDLILLGIGANGHIGFNEPGEALAGPTHVVRLEASTRRSNAARFGSESAVPTHALSMGMAAILGAKRVLLVATGKEKAPAIEQALHGPQTPGLPASLLQAHGSVDVYLDRGAASLLRDGVDAVRAG